MWATNPELARKFEAETPKGANLPDRVNDRSSVPPPEKQEQDKKDKESKKKKAKKKVKATQESVLRAISLLREAKGSSIDDRRARLLNRINNPSDRDKRIAVGTAGAAVGAAIPQVVSRTIHHPYKVADKIMTELVNKNIKNKTLHDKAIRRSKFRSRALKHSAWRMRRKAPTTMKVLAGVTAILGANKALKASRRKPTDAQ
jgi:hypothetical protein